MVGRWPGARSSHQGGAASSLTAKPTCAVPPVRAPLVALRRWPHRCSWVVSGCHGRCAGGAGKTSTPPFAILRLRRQPGERISTRHFRVRVALQQPQNIRSGRSTGLRRRKHRESGGVLRHAPVWIRKGCIVGMSDKDRATNAADGTNRAPPPPGESVLCAGQAQREDHQAGATTNSPHCCQANRNRWQDWPHWLTAASATVIMVVTGVYACTSDRQWHAMLESNRINNSSLVTSQRAFIYFTIPTFTSDDRANQKFNVRVGIGNSGNTPTRELSYSVGCVLADAKGGMDPEKTTKAPIQTMIGPRVIITPYGCSFTLNGNGTIQNADGQSAAGVAIMGSANYRDIIQPSAPHETRFCYIVTQFEAAPHLVDLRALSIPCPGVRYNCADDECKEQDKQLANGSSHSALQAP